ncbi:MAG: hypothetical protein K2G97_01630, partial [Oscillospiraceae bacterium]|nr:hypothetical protein [Oscillospiraceae bacterium]
ELAFIKTLNRTAKFQNVTFDNYSVEDVGSSTSRPRSYNAAAFAINNNGYILNVNLKNSRMVNVNKTSKRGKTAGFVVNNEQGKIILLNEVNVCGLLVEYGLIENYSIDMNFKNSNISAGFVYKNNWAINNCSSNCSVKGTKSKNAYLGGFCSKNLAFGNISNCKSSGSIKADKALSTNRCGGFIGANYGNINYCSSTGNVKSVGTILSNFEYKYLKKDVTSYVGGFCGQNLGNISDCDAKGSAIASAAIKKAKVGGFVGENAKGEITRCMATGDSMASSYSCLASMKIGGFVGVNKSKILNSKSSNYLYLSMRHSQRWKNARCGGFAGQNAKNGNIEGCYAECKVETNNKKGAGFVGEAEAKSTIKNSKCKTVCVKGANSDGSEILEKAEFCYHKSKKAVIENCAAN